MGFMKVSCLPLAVCCLAMWGCGKSPPTTIPVHGQVTWEGKPLTTGTVTFQPVKTGEGQPLRPAKGSLGPDGTYRLSMFRTHDGAMPGEYAVVIHSHAADSSIDRIGLPSKSIIPEKYGNSATSGLRATIPADASGALKFDFQLD